MFDPASRYFHLPNAQHVAPDGRVHEYKRRRFRPLQAPAIPPRPAVLQAHDRLDLLSARALGQPELFWLLADANSGLDPWALTGVERAGHTLLIPMAHPGAQP